MSSDTEQDRKAEYDDLDRWYRYNNNTSNNNQESTISNSSNGHIQEFPKKLFNLANDAAVPEIEWSNLGTIIVVKTNDKIITNKKFGCSKSKDVPPDIKIAAYFGHNNRDSLLKQFNKYGFMRVKIFVDGVEW